MINFSLENILLILIIIYVINGFYTCYNSKSSKLENFENEIKIIKNGFITMDIDKLNKLKIDEKVDILFNLYINILKLLNHLSNNKLVQESLDILEKNIKIIIKKDNIKEILGDELYDKNIKLYNNIRESLDKDNNKNVIDMKK